jgi:regulator of protease activity HflC (stomatin/prohibitin superfamily)
MTADHLSHKRAAMFSLLGLGLQGVLGLAVLIYSVLASDRAGLTAAISILCGCIVWLVLAVVFDQHRRERLEALEAESIAAAAARQTTVFAEAAEDLRVAHRRLMWMHRFLVPAASLVLAAMLIGLGLWRFVDARHAAFQPPEDRFRPWQIALGLALALAGFLFGRWISGMAKQRVWSALRAGATQAVWAALLGLAMAVGQFVDAVGPDTVLRALPLVFSALMVVLGGEIVLNFVLAAYQPRKAGEMPRPAFDSRVLGFVAAPDRIAESIGEAINYQFGFEVTSSWFYQLLSRSFPALVLVGAGVVWGMTMFAVVGADERALRVRNGSLAGEVGPGLYLKYPWPIERFERFKATEARRLDLASPPPEDNKPVLWTNEHVTDEARYYLFCRAPADGSAGAPRAESEYRDLALVAVEVPVQYTVENVEKFETRLGPPGFREEVLKAEGQRVLMRHLLTVRLDEILGASRGRISREIEDLVRRRFEELDCGIRVLFVGIEGAHPPTPTATNFEQVVATQHTKQAQINKAMEERVATLAKAAGSVEAAERFMAEHRAHAALSAELESLRARAGASPSAADREAVEALQRQVTLREQEMVRILTEGRGGAAAILREAKRDRWARHMDSRGRAESYRGQLAAYRAAPAVFTAQRYFDAMRSVLAAARVYIVSDDIELTVRANNEDVDSSGNPLTAPRPSEE